MLDKAGNVNAHLKYQLIFQSSEEWAQKEPLEMMSLKKAPGNIVNENKHTGNICTKPVFIKLFFFFFHFVWFYLSLFSFFL